MTIDQLIQHAAEVLSGAVLQGVPEGDHEAALVYALVCEIERACKARKEELRERLMTLAQARGRETSNGHAWESECASVLVTRRESKTPDDKRFRALLLKHEIELDEAYDTVKRYVYNPSKVDLLVATGHLEDEDIEALKSRGMALRVAQNTLSKAELIKARQVLFPEGDEE